MRSRVRALGGALLLTCALPALMSCSSGSDRDAAPPGPSAARRRAEPAPVVEPDPVLHLGVAGVQSLDPALLNPASPSDTIVADLLYDGLTSYDASAGEVTSGLATGWSVSADSLRWTFQLDPDARFSDGSAVTAADAKASLERVVQYGSQSVSGLRLSVIDGYDEFVADPEAGLRGLQAVDETTLIVQLEAPFPSLDSLFSDPTYGIVPAGLPADDSAFAETPVGSGPFAVTARTAETIETTRRDGSPASLRGVTLHLFDDATAAHEAFTRGQLDVSVIGIDDVAAATAARERVISAPLRVSMFYGMNVKAPALTSSALRQAIVKAIDRDGIRQRVFGGAVDTMTGLLGPGVAALRTDACGGSCAHDSDGAKAVIQQAFPDGNVPTVHVDYFEESTGREAAVANEIVADLEAVGIPAVPRAHPFDQYSAVVTSGYAELFRFGWIGTYPSSDAYLDPLFASGGSDNVFSLADGDVDAALSEARSTSDDAARIAAVQRAEDRVLGLDVIVPLVQHRSHLVVTGQVDSVVVAPDGTVDLERIALTRS